MEAKGSPGEMPDTNSAASAVVFPEKTNLESTANTEKSFQTETKTQTENSHSSDTIFSDKGSTTGVGTESAEESNTKQETSNGTSNGSGSSKVVPVKKAMASSPVQNSISILHSIRRSERIQKQAAKAEEARRIREERAAIEDARTKQRSIAAKKAAATKRKAQQLAKEAGESSKLLKIAPANSPSSGAATSKPLKKIIKIRYLNVRPLPVFSAINLKENTPELFWLRLNLREFLLRFDKLCRIPVRFASGMNDPLSPYTPEQLKSVALALLKLINNDPTPLHNNVAFYIAEIDALEASNANIWDWLLDFVEQLDAYAPHEVPTTEEEQLELLRRLMVICTGTETIRITVMTDIDQLKIVEKEAQDEIKAIGAKFKETEAKLAKLKKVDKEVWKEKLDTAHRSMENKIWRCQQQLYTKTHKYNMRTSPIYTDPAGNRYWSFQYKSSTHSEWGSWIVCEIIQKPTDMLNWYKKVGKDVQKVLKSRDELINQKNAEKKLKKDKNIKSNSSGGDTVDISKSNSIPLPSSENSDSPSLSQSKIKIESVQDDFRNETKSEDKTMLIDTGSTESKQGCGIPECKPKRRYPKLKITPLAPMKEVELYYVEGKENILALAKWLRGFPGADAKAISEIENVAAYLATEG